VHHRKFTPIPRAEISAMGRDTIRGGLIVIGSATSRLADVRLGWRARICMAPAPHVDGDPSWGLARSRRPGASAGRPRKVVSEISGHLTAE
jgi:hypothetical protein